MQQPDHGPKSGSAPRFQQPESFQIMKKSYTVSSALRINTIKKAIRQSQSMVGKIQKQIVDKLLDSHGIEELKASCEGLKSRTQLLKDELQAQKALLKEKIENRNSLMSSNEDIAWDLMSRYEALVKDKARLAEFQKRHYECRETYLKTYAQLMLRKKQMITEMCAIYPINEASNRGMAICGVHLPNSEDFQGHEEVSLSVALGYVCHFLCLLTSVLDIPLRYQITLAGSRSKITDHIRSELSDKDRDFPLYSRSKSKPYFDYGVYLLNKDIAQLRHHFDLSFQDLRATLPNLYSLIQLRLTLKSEPNRTLPESISYVRSPYLPATPSTFHSFSKGSDDLLNGSNSPHNLMEKAEILHAHTEHAKCSFAATDSYDHHPSAESSATYERPDREERVFRAGWQLEETSSALSGSLDQGLNKISTSRIEGHSATRYQKTSKKLNRKIRKSLNHHGSEPNLSDNLPLAVCSLQLAECSVGSEDNMLNRDKLGSSVLNVWTGSSSRTNSDDESIDRATPSPVPWLKEEVGVNSPGRVLDSSSLANQTMMQEVFNLSSVVAANKHTENHP